MVKRPLAKWKSVGSIPITRSSAPLGRDERGSLDKVEATRSARLARQMARRPDQVSEARPPEGRGDPLHSMPTLYVLRSLKDNRTYVGSTDNFDRRLLQHNSGKVISTKHRTPFKVLFTEEFETLKEARKRELYYKSGAGRRKLKEYFNKP